MAADPLDRFAESVYRALNPDPLDQLAEAVNGLFADQAARERSRQLASADLLARHRELRARSEAKYGQPEALYDRLQARGSGLSAQIWS